MMLRPLVKLIILCFLNVTFVRCLDFSNTLSANVILTIMGNFKIRNPIIINTQSKRSKNIQLFKVFSQNGQQITFNIKNIQKSQSFIIFTEIEKLKWEIHTNGPILVITRIEDKSNLYTLNINIGTEMYFLDYKTLKIFESYVINGRHIVKYFGQFQMHDQINFVKTDDYIPSLIKRRSNFHGMQLIGMTEYEPPMIYFPRDFAKKVTYFSNNDTYDMTYLVSGYFIDALHSLEKKYNFTMKLYKRNDGGWGMPETLENGTVVATGMLQNMNDGTAEFIWAPIAIFLKRTLVVDYLPIIDRANAAIYITATGNFENIDWALYCGSFTLLLWQGLLISSVGIAISFYLMECLHLKERPVSYQFVLFGIISNIKYI